MAAKRKLDKKPVIINKDGRPVSYIGRFAPWWIVRWLRKKIWGIRW